MKRTLVHKLHTTIATCVLVSSILSSTHAQQLSPQTQALLAQKGEVLKSMQMHKQHEADAQRTVEQARAVREMAKKEGLPDDAATAQQAIDVAQQAMEQARKARLADEQRLAALNEALTWQVSENPRAVPTLVRGRVLVQRGNGGRLLQGVEPIKVGDRIVVGDNSSLEMQLQDGTRMTLGPNTTFEYHEAGEHSAAYLLLKGMLHSSHQCFPGAGYPCGLERRVGTPMATVAVRGTDFTVQSDERTDVFTVLEGAIDVQVASSGQTVVVHGGEQLTLARNLAVAKPETINPKAILHWWEAR